MAIIIDGYNLMHVTRFAVGPNEPRRFDEARNAMLLFLDHHLQKLGETDVSIVFDSDRQTTLPSEYDMGGLRVYFARDYPTADDLIEELIQSAKSSETLTVVSSDHRLHIAAKRKRCIAVDSDVWFDAMLERCSAIEDDAKSDDTTAEAQLTDDEPKSFHNPFPDGYAEDLG